MFQLFVLLCSISGPSCGSKTHYFGDIFPPGSLFWFQPLSHISPAGLCPPVRLIWPIVSHRRVWDFDKCLWLENKEAPQPPGPTGDWETALNSIYRIDCIHCCQGSSVTPFNKVTVSVALCLPVCTDRDIWVFITIHYRRIKNIISVCLGGAFSRKMKAVTVPEQTSTDAITFNTSI